MSADGEPPLRVALVWRGDEAARSGGFDGNERLRPVADALSRAGIAVHPLVFDEGWAAETRARLLDVDGVLVWVDPISAAGDRSALDELLREIAAAGVFVSAHPDVILKMGTKEVLFQTRELGWGSDTRVYREEAEFFAEFPRRLAEAGPRVLKPYRGNGGLGVWKVALVDAGPATRDRLVRVQLAQHRGTDTEDLPLGEFMDRRATSLAGGGRLVDQEFQPRVAEGMIRAYLTGDRVVGFARQAADPTQPPAAVLGLPAAKVMYDADTDEFRILRKRLESEWVPGLQEILGIGTDELPLLWDTDFLYGPKAANGTDSYVLCEINVSCITPFPPAAPAAIARAVRPHLETARRRPAS